MMDQMMGGGMMWGMGLIGLLVIIVLLLAAAALVKYLFFSSAAEIEVCEGWPARGVPARNAARLHAVSEIVHKFDRRTTVAQE